MVDLGPIVAAIHLVEEAQKLKKLIKKHMSSGIRNKKPTIPLNETSINLQIYIQTNCYFTIVSFGIFNLSQIEFT